MWENKFPSRPSGNAVSNDIAWQHYTERGVRKLHESGTTFAEDMEALFSKMPNSIEAASLKNRPRIRIEDRTPRLRAIGHGMKLLTRQAPRSLIQRVQKMEEVPQVQFIDNGPKP